MAKVPAVIVQADSQVDRVKRLVEYCERLDGTRVTVFEQVFGTDMPYPVCNTMAFNFVSRNELGGLRHQAFFWLEPDAIPLKKGWLEDLTYEWQQGGKPFLLSADYQMPYDLIGGIGIYGPETYDLLPAEYEYGAWDGFILQRLPAFIHRTKSIQHTYGLYEQPGLPPEMALPHRFPAELHIIRPDAKIFHRDKYQDLINL